MNELWHLIVLSIALEHHACGHSAWQPYFLRIIWILLLLSTTIGNY